MAIKSIWNKSFLSFKRKYAFSKEAYTRADVGTRALWKMEMVAGEFCNVLKRDIVVLVVVAVVVCVLVRGLLCNCDLLNKRGLMF